MVKLNLATAHGDELEQPNALKQPKQPKQAKPKKTKAKKQKPSKVRTVMAPTNRRPKLVEEGVMSHHNFMSVTRDSHIDIYRLNPQQHNRYEIEAEPTAKTAILKLILTIKESLALTPLWANGLWNMVQQLPDLDPRVRVTSVRSFERLDTEAFGRRVRNRQWTSVFKIGKKAQTSSNPAVNYDKGLYYLGSEKAQAIVSFGAEIIVTAPDEVLLETSINLIASKFNEGGKMTGMKYAIDLNKQDRPFTIYGTGFNSGHSDVTFNLSGADAATTALIVDAGGDRSEGAEYVGKSTGKMIFSHAAYNFMNRTSLFVGNDSQRRTHTLQGYVDLPSQIYLAQVASRAYLLRGKRVTHIVLDNGDNTRALEEFPLSSQRTIRAREGKLNIIEPIATVDNPTDDARVAQYNGHVAALATLLNQFRAEPDDEDRASFINDTKSIIREFFSTHGYWNPDITTAVPELFGEHSDFKTVNDFLITVHNEIQRLRIKMDSRKTLENMEQLHSVLSENIMSNARAFDVKTDPIVDEWVRSDYRILDVTGFTAGSLGGDANDASVMVLSYLNILMHAFESGDLIVFHGASHIERILPMIHRMLKNTNRQLDICYTEGNEMRAANVLRTSFKHEETGKQLLPDLSIVDLYQNDVTGLVDTLHINAEWASDMGSHRSVFFVNAHGSVDYIWLDQIL